jgi:pimeloyl-ACP methyl ester carboxylesterase
MWAEQFVALESGRTRAMARGRGPALVWTHSLFHPIDVEEKTPLGPMLSAIEGRRVIRYDARGQGRSDPGADALAHRWDRLGRDLIEVATALDAKSCVLAGASMGAVASVFAALEGGLDVRAMVLVLPPTAWATRPRQADMYRAILRLLERLGLPAVIRTFEQYLTDKTMTPGFEDAREALLENLRRFEPESLAKILRASAESDLAPPETLRRLSMPCLIVAVEGDPGHPRSTAETLAEHLPNASLEVYPRISAGELARTIQRFLDRVWSTIGA